MLTKRILCIGRSDTRLRKTGTRRNDSAFVIEVKCVVLVEELTDSLVYLERRVHVLSMYLNSKLELKRYRVQVRRECLGLSIDDTCELCHRKTVRDISGLDADAVKLQTTLRDDVEITVYLLDADFSTLV